MYEPGEEAVADVDPNGRDGGTCILLSTYCGFAGTEILWVKIGAILDSDSLRGDCGQE